MIRITILLLVLLLMLASVVSAQDSTQARTVTPLNMRAGPGSDYEILTHIATDTVLVLEGRSANNGWVIGRTSDGLFRGWVASRYLRYDFRMNTLPVSDEVITPDTPDPLNRPVLYEAVDHNDGVEFLLARTASIDLSAYPVVPTNTDTARKIFARGQTMGRDPHAVSKLGDCISNGDRFLSPFGLNNYILGDYTQLQAVIDHFGESLAYDSLATYDGLVTSAALDPAFADPGPCLVGESPLHCELRVHNASVAIVMFGAQDLLFTPPEQFDRNLRRIVHETMQSGVIPILSTFPVNISLWDASVQYNQIVVQIALDFDLPLLNLWRALETLPDYGVYSDGRHLSDPITTAGDLVGDNLLRGYPLRNLVTLQALDAVWRGAME